MPLAIAVCVLLLIGVPAAPAQQDPEQLFERAVRLQQAGKWAEAEQAYRAYMKIAGPTPEALANLGAVLAREERFEDAIGAYARALKLAPRSIPIHMNLGLAYFKAGQLAPAVEEFTAVLGEQAGNVQARQLRAMSLFELERYDESLRDYVALMPSSDVNVRLGLASAYLKLGRTAEARKIMESLYATDTAEAKLLLGQVLIQTEQYGEARQALDRALQLNPKLPTVHLNLGAIYWKEQKSSEAIAEWREELKLYPETFQANYTLGAALAFVEGHDEESVRLLRKAIALKPANALALCQMGKLLVRQSKYAEAVPFLERAVQADPKFRQAHFALGTAYQNLGRNLEAKSQFAIVRQLSREELRETEDLFESTR